MSYRVTRQHGFAPHHLLVVLAAVAGVVLVGFVVQHAVAVEKERKTYQEADQQITRFVDEASKLAPSTKSIERYCSRSSAKFEEGSLGCEIRGSVEYSKPSTAQSEKIQQLKTANYMPWQFKYDNTKNLLEKYDGKILVVRVYSYGELVCRFTYEYKPLDPSFDKVDITKPQVVYGCSGNALEEYY